MNKGGNVRERGIYVLPSLFTTGGLFAGFYALIAAVQGRFELAAWALIVAAVFDMLDGRVARLLHAESEFGAQYDSLCDMLSFGIAPAVLVYLWALVPLHKPGWLAAFLVAACAALRLARFNVQLDVQDKRFFNGLPTPATAMLIATAVLFHEDHGVQPLPWLWFAISVALAWLMVSRVPFFAGKDVDLKQRHPAVLLLAMLALIVFIMADPHTNLFVLALAYCLHGPLLAVRQWRWPPKRPRAAEPDARDDAGASSD
jgi:CDP-diacylglycerol--serine O-phosphatidyltransferase